MDFAIGMKTNAPEMMSVTISGPSILGVDVITTAQSAAQKRPRITHWLFVRGLRMMFLVFNC